MDFDCLRSMGLQAAKANRLSGLGHRRTADSVGSTTTLWITGANWDDTEYQSFERL